MACINPAQQYQWKISDLFDSFLNSMKDSRARVEVDSQRHKGLCIVKITLWKCRSCPKHLYLFRTLFYVRGQRDITNLERHLDSLVSLYSVSTPSESSDTDIEPEAEPQVSQTFLKPLPKTHQFHGSHDKAIIFLQQKSLTGGHPSLLKQN